MFVSSYQYLVFFGFVLYNLKKEKNLFDNKFRAFL